MSLGLIVLGLLVSGCATKQTQETAQTTPPTMQQPVLGPEGEGVQEMIVQGSEETETLTEAEVKSLKENLPRGEPLDDEIVTIEDNAAESAAQKPQVRTFDVEVDNWYFQPEVIEVSLGDTVVLNFNTIDGVHGFALPEFNVNQRLSPGKAAQVTFVAEKKGEFTFFCNVVCGSGHSKMRGKLSVK